MWVCASVCVRTLQVNLFVLIKHLMETTSRNDALMHTVCTSIKRYGDAEDNGPTGGKRMWSEAKFSLLPIARTLSTTQHSAKQTHQMKLKQNRKWMFFPKLTCCRWRTFWDEHAHAHTPAKGIKNKSEIDNGNRKTIKMLINFFSLFLRRPGPTKFGTDDKKRRDSTPVNLTFFLFFISSFFLVLTLMSYFGWFSSRRNAKAIGTGKKVFSSLNCSEKTKRISWRFSSHNSPTFWYRSTGQNSR